jgi:glutamate synthase domain-containing protein 2
MPLRDGLSFAIDTLRGYDLKKEIRVVASGKAFNGFHVARLIAIGADMVNVARAMMLATGCIQALQCNKNTCPIGELIPISRECLAKKKKTSMNSSVTRN